jgi:hypothetical protein
MGHATLSELMSVKSVCGMNAVGALRVTGMLVDLAADSKNEAGLRHAIILLEEFVKQGSPEIPRGIAQYFLGNAWAALRILLRAERPESWDWEQEEFEKEIVALRTARQATVRPDFPRELSCCIFTNLGNALSHIGRFIEAIECWDNALNIAPHFAMAQGNKGFFLFYYAGALNDDGHRAVFARFAQEYLERALNGELDQAAREGFKALLARLQKITKSRGPVPRSFMDKYSLGRTREEKAYRKWCLGNRLFLNPLNDLGEYTIAARDVLTLPSVVVKRGEGPYYHGFFNQMKQEFVSARYLLYSGSRTTTPHFSDKDVFLTNTMDYPAWCLAVEHQKLAFRSAYSILDKISFFLNHYLGLGIPEKRVSFRGLWYNKQERKQGIRSEFASRRDWPLRGLYWLSKDLFEDQVGFRTSLDLDAQNLAEIRNHLEHKYLKLHGSCWSGPPDSSSPILMGLSDSLAYSLRREEFGRNAMKVLRLARAALIYLSLSVHREERLRTSARDPNARIAPILLDTWEDNWKA